MRTTPRPPLTKRLRPRHWTAIDYVVGALFGLIVFFSGLRQAVPVRGSGSAELLALVLAAGAAIAVAQRRKRPWLMLGLLLTGSLLVTIITGGSDAAVNFFLAAAYVLYPIVATSEERRVLSRAFAAVLAAVVLDGIMMMVLGGGPRESARLVPVVLCLAFVWSMGYIVRQRRRYAIGLQVEAASKAVAEERLRIARELHDVVAHSMSVIAVQAGYGQYVIDSQPADAREALSAIQATSREALDEMRRMLGALRSADEADPPGNDVELPAASAAEGGGTLAGLFRQVAQVAAPAVAATSAASASAAPLFPAPGLGDLDRLLSRTACAGLQVELERRGQVAELPASIDRSAYRIIQEALTNVVKHARASRCDVLIDYSDAELTIEVTDSGAGVPVLSGATTMRASAEAGYGVNSGGYGSGVVGGHGIIGMRERVSLLGGSFSAGPLPGYGFRVTARIPLPHGAG